MVGVPGVSHEAKALLDIVIKQMEETLFYFMEAPENPRDEDHRTMMKREMHQMYIRDLTSTYTLDPVSSKYLSRQVGMVIDKRAILLQRSPVQQDDGTRFILHAVAILNKSLDPHAHQAHRLSFTAGIGNRPWVEYSPREQDVVKDFIFDLHRGTHHEDALVMDINTNEDRLTCAFATRTLFKT